MARIGLVSGQDFDPSKLRAFDTEAVNAVPKMGLMKMAKRVNEQPLINGWFVFGANVGNGAPIICCAPPQRGSGRDLICGRTPSTLISLKDTNGNDYTGADRKYVLHFDKGQFPPVNVTGFWSLTMYGEDNFLAANPLNRYTLSQRDNFVTNPDGSVDLYLQADSPGTAKEANWLPAPRAKCGVLRRLYWPTDTAPSIIDGTWKPPAIKVVQ
jgi:hypothetical protein